MNLMGVVMKNILVPVDGSEPSLRALRAALTLAKDQSSTCTVHVLNVQAPIISNNVARFFTADVLDAYYQDEGKEALKTAKALLAQEQIPYQIHITVGQIAEKVQAYIEEHNCDHVVMGTRGLGAVPGLLLGSATTKVLSRITVPITLIK